MKAKEAAEAVAITAAEEKKKIVGETEMETIEITKKVAGTTEKEIAAKEALIKATAEAKKTAEIKIIAEKAASTAMKTKETALVVAKEAERKLKETIVATNKAFAAAKAAKANAEMIMGITNNQKANNQKTKKKGWFGW
jgi:hypothetical protein